jgi:3-hydroxyacyl-CoA dehydrogenase
MGAGIAQVTAQAGFNVSLVDQNETILGKALVSIKTSLKRSTKKKFEKEPEKAEEFINEIMSRIQTSTQVEDAANKTDLVIEAIIENLKIKHQLFSVLDKVCPSETIFTSNTSSIAIKEIAEPVARKDKFGGLHFFNPVPVMKLLEVIKTDETNDQTYTTLLEFGNLIGKTTVQCKDSLGFIVNRLLIPYNAEAVRMYERGDATFQDIDVAMKLGAGYPMGPFELSDYVGLDTSKMIGEGWSKRFPNNPTYVPSKIIEKLVSEGKLGRKSGEGFYKYSK